MVWHTTIGGGPTKVVVIHGWFSDHRVFAPIFDCLDADLYTYAFIDIRGYGNSRNLSGKYRSAKSQRTRSRWPTTSAGTSFMSSAIPWGPRQRRRW
jgi:pimeloyl-ACP methyl ester carboxylesterase